MGNVIDRKTLKSSTNTQYGRDAKSAKADTHHAGFGRTGADFIPKKDKPLVKDKGVISIVTKEKEKEKKP